MSLREEVIKIIKDGTINDLKYGYIAEDAINKILDAAVDAVIDVYDEDFPPTAAVIAINKLRDKK